MLLPRQLTLSLVVATAHAFNAPNNNNKKAPVTLIDMKNASQLKDIFFSGNPWLVQCGSANDLSAAAAGDGKLALHEVVELALPKLPAQVGVLDCAKKLPSGKTTLDRFKLDGKLLPTLIFAANGQAPIQLMPNMLGKALASTLFPSTRQQAGALVALVKSRAKKQALLFTKSDQLHKHCFKKKHCALILMPKQDLTSEQSQTLQKLMYEHRSVTFGTINSARYDFSLAKHLPQPPTPKTPQLVAFKSTPAAGGEAGSGSSGSSKKKNNKGGGGGGMIALSAKAHRGDFSASELKPFLASLVEDSLDMTSLKKAPTMQWKKQDKSKGGSSSSSSSSASKEKRKDSGGAGSGRQSRRASSQGGGGSSARGGKEGKTQAGGGGGGSGGGGGGGGGPSDEVRRRQKMAEEEEEYMKSMFGGDEDEDEEEGGGGEADGGGVGDEEDEEEALDFDEDEEEGGGVEEEGGEEDAGEDEDDGAAAAHDEL